MAKPEEFRVWIPATSPIMTDGIIGELVTAIASQVAKGELRSIQSSTLKHWVSSTDPLFTDGSEGPDGYTCAFTFSMMAVRGAKSEVPS